MLEKKLSFGSDIFKLKWNLEKVLINYFRKYIQGVPRRFTADTRGTQKPFLF